MPTPSNHFISNDTKNEDAHGPLLERSGFTREKLVDAVAKADVFHQRYAEMMSTTGEDQLPAFKPGKQEQKFIRQHDDDVPTAVVAKLGSNSIAKRKPAEEHLPPFVDYVRKQFEAKEPLLFRLGLGPVKNVRHYGDNQTPDIAEHLMMVNLARMVSSVATLYPHGVKIEMVPDDQRGGGANLWPAEYGKRYIKGMKQLIGRLGYGWATVEDGQKRLYEKYGVKQFVDVAHELLARQEQDDPQAYDERLRTAAAKARDNLMTSGATGIVSDDEAKNSARRYILMLEAEKMSNMFEPIDAFPLRFGNHPNSFQIYTMGEGLTKLPWQIALPYSLLSPDKPRAHVPVTGVPAQAWHTQTFMPIEVPTNATPTLHHRPVGRPAAALSPQFAILGL